MAVDVAVARRGVPTPTGRGSLPTWIPRCALVLVALLAVAGVTVLLVTAQTGPVASRIRNPAPHATHTVYGAPRAHPALWGLDWPLIVTVAFPLVVAILVGWMAWVSWRRRRLHNGFTVLAAVSLLAVMDPPVNWAAYAVYDPRLLHLPVTWPWASVSPTVEPIVAVVGGYGFFLVLPALAAFSVYRSVRSRVPFGSWPDRHPFWTLSIIGCAVGAMWDVPAELLMMEADLYHYTQWWGPAFGFSNSRLMVIEILLVAFLVGVIALLLWEDDRGRSISSRLARRFRLLRGKPRLSEFIVMTTILMTVYTVGYFGSFALIRLTNSATQLYRPWPYQDTKVYDPDGRYRASGEPGPYYPGIWSQPPSPVGLHSKTHGRRRGS